MKYRKIISNIFLNYNVIILQLPYKKEVNYCVIHNLFAYSITINTEIYRRRFVIYNTFIYISNEKIIMINMSVFSRP